MTPPSSAERRGQAAVEYVALIGLVALLALAIAVWMPRHVSGTLDTPPTIPAPSVPSVPNTEWLLPTGDDFLPTGVREWLDSLPPLARIGLTWFVTNAGMMREVTDQTMEFLDDPGAALRDFFSAPRVPRPQDMFRTAAARLREARRYVAELRRMDRMDAFTRLSFDFGRLEVKAARTYLFSWRRLLAGISGRRPSGDEAS